MMRKKKKINSSDVKLLNYETIKMRQYDENGISKQF